MTDCLIGGLTNEEARQELVAYFTTSYTASGLTHEVIYPNQKPPSIEDRNTPFILLTLIEINREQEYIGSSEYIIDKFLSIELWVREFTGYKTISIFTDFIDSLGLKIVNGIVYKTPKYMAPKNFKGWELTPVALPFKF